MNDRIKKAKKNIIFGAMLIVSSSIPRIVLRIVFTNVLSKDILGIKYLFSNVFSVMDAIRIAFITAFAYALYKPLADNNLIEIKNILNIFKKYCKKILMVTFIIGILLIPFIRYIVNSDIVAMKDIYVYYLMYLISYLTSYIYLYKKIIISADQNEYVIKRINIIIELIKFGIQIAVLLYLKSFIVFLIIELICPPIINLICAKIADKKYEYVKNLNKISVNENKKNYYEMIKNAKNLIIFRCFWVLNEHTDSVLISIFINTAMTGIYSNYISIFSLISSFITAIYSSISSNIGNLSVTTNKEIQEKKFKMIDFSCFILSSFCSVIIIGVAQDFIGLIFGDDYIMNNFTVFILAICFYVTNSRTAIWTFRKTIGLYEEMKYVPLLTTVVNIILSIILVNIIGLAGIIIATIISYLTTIIWIESRLLYNNYFEKSVKNYYIRYVLNLLYTISIQFGVFYLCNEIIIDSIILKIGIKIIVSCVIYVITFIICYKDKTELKELKNLIIPLLTKSCAI